MEFKKTDEKLFEQMKIDKEKIISIYERYSKKVYPFKDYCFKVSRKGSKRYYYDFKGGKEYNENEFHNLISNDTKYHTITNNNQKAGQIVEYDEETDCLVFTNITVKNIDKECKKKGFSVLNILVMNRYKSVCKINENKAYVVLPDTMEYCFNFTNEARTKIVEYFGEYVLLKGNTPYILNNHSNYGYFLNYKEVLRQEGPKQTLIDELTSEKVEFINRTPSQFIKDKIDYREDVPTPIVGYYYSKKQCFAKADLQILNNGYLLLRGYYEFVDEANNTETIEAIRFYYKDDKCIKARRCIDNTFITAKGIKPDHCMFRVELENISDEVYEKTNLKYMKEIIENTPAKNRMYFIYQLLDNPDIEKLYKIGLVDIVKEIARRTEPASEIIENYLGTTISGKKKNIIAKYGINSYQLEKTLEIFDIGNYKKSKIIYNLRKIVFDLSSIDNETFDRLLKIQKDIIDKEKVHEYMPILTMLTNLKGLNYTMDKVEKLLSLTNSIRYSCLAERNYLDIIRMFRTLQNNITDDVFKFTTIEDIQTTHTNLIFLTNKQKYEILNADFSSLQSKWNKYKYEDDEYMIIAPEKANDLAKEGLELHHCVKSYIEAVAEGRTNILFLRKKINPDKPFFTIEITNDDKIRQIHGFANCNIDSDKEAEEFYKKWLKAKKIENYSRNGAYCVRR